MRRIQVDVTGGSADSDSIALSQTIGTVSNAVTLNGVSVSGGTATFPSALPVTVQSYGDDSGLTFEISGKNEQGYDKSETLAGVSIGVAMTDGYFVEVSSIIASGPTASSIVAGNGADAVSIPVPMDQYNNPFQVGLGLVVNSGTLTVQHTFDAVFDSNWDPATANWFDHASLVNATISADGNYDKAVSAIRLTGEGEGSLAILQSGVGL